MPRVYSGIVTPQLRVARELAGKIKRRKLGTDHFFSGSDVYLKRWSGLDSLEAVKNAAEVLRMPDGSGTCPPNRDHTEEPFQSV